MCSLALSCNNYCHSRVSSCMQVPLRHTQPHVPSLQNEFMMGFACMSPLLLCAEARKLPCLQGCPTLLFQAQYAFVERGFCSFFGEVGMVAFQPTSLDTSYFPLPRAGLSNHSPGLPDISAKAPRISARPGPLPLCSLE